MRYELQLQLRTVKASALQVACDLLIFYFCDKNKGLRIYFVAEGLTLDFRPKEPSGRCEVTSA